MFVLRPRKNCYAFQRRADYVTETEGMLGRRRHADWIRNSAAMPVRSACVTWKHFLSIEVECSHGISETRVRLIQPLTKRAWLPLALHLPSACGKSRKPHQQKPCQNCRMS